MLPARVSKQLVSAGMGGDFDPNDDPELAMALRVSLEEQRQRQEGAVAAADASAGAGQEVAQYSSTE